MKLTKTSRTAIDKFAEAAQAWGWQRDCGTGHSVDVSERDYLEAKKVLEARILRLEEQNRKLRKQNSIAGCESRYDA